MLSKKRTSWSTMRSPLQLLVLACVRAKHQENHPHGADPCSSTLDFMQGAQRLPAWQLHLLARGRRGPKPNTGCHHPVFQGARHPAGRMHQKSPRAPSSSCKARVRVLGPNRLHPRAGVCSSSLHPAAARASRRTRNFPAPGPCDHASMGGAACLCTVRASPPAPQSLLIPPKKYLC